MEVREGKESAPLDLNPGDATEGAKRPGGETYINLLTVGGYLCLF